MMMAKRIRLSNEVGKGKGEEKEEEVKTLEITIVPLTWIIAPLVTKEQLKRWHDKKWIDDDGLHLDRAFPRDCEGNAILFRFWLESPMVKVARTFKDPEKYHKVAREWEIIDEHGFPVNYVKIGKPLRYRRVILAENKRTTEFFEYIDGTYYLTFKVRTKWPKEFVELLASAGRIGIMARTKHGYGKFYVIVGRPKEVKEEKEEESKQ